MEYYVALCSQTCPLRSLVLDLNSRAVHILGNEGNEMHRLSCYSGDTVRELEEVIARHSKAIYMTESALPLRGVRLFQFA
jgi:hypothetical protein